jgi:NAD(P)-dependent dehydrogenase (short-subunit alcohol dehydrogenase family)
MTKKLAGKVALITGASKGIGRGLAIALASHGAQVAISYKTDKAGAEATRSEIRQLGGMGEIFQADIGSRPAFEELIEATCQMFGGLDILVNNAARTRFAPFHEITEEDFEDVINTNLRGPFFGSAAAAPKLIQRGGGTIINVSSCAARLMLPFHSAYSMAKGGLEALTRQLALELAPHIRVNAIAPGPTSTERNRGYDPEYDRQWSAVIPAGRLALVEDYAGICVFLASDESAFVTGQIIGVDGGWTVKGYPPDMSKSDFSKDRDRD